MSFLADFLTDVFTTMGVGGITSSGRKRPHYFVGGFVILLGMGLLYLYFVYRPSPVYEYHRISLTYPMCYLKGDGGNREIVLELEGKKYRLSYKLWRKNYGDYEALEALNRSLQATIWLPSADSDAIKGIETPHFRIDTSAEAEWDKANRKKLLWIAASCCGLGILLIVVVYFSELPH